MASTAASVASALSSAGASASGGRGGGTCSPGGPHRGGSTSATISSANKSRTAVGTGLRPGRIVRKKTQQVVQWKTRNVQEGIVIVDEAQLCRLIKRDPIEKFYDMDPEPFATGMFASVRRCRSRDSGLQLAAKFSSRLRYGADCSAEIHHEIALLSLCSPSPRVIKLHDVFQTDKEIILVMEYAPGGDLQTLIDDNVVPYESDVVSFTRQLVEGLAYLHHRKIAHLDIKPQNLVMMGDFPDCDVKLCDFEISRVILEGTEIREILGTPDYVAPEILHYEPITMAADLWSLGVTVYVLLTGFSPFGGETDQETFCNISRAQLDFPEELFEDVSPEAQDFIRRLLQRDPRSRPTAKECLRHPWLSQQAGRARSCVSCSTPNVATHSLRKYLSKSREALFERVLQRGVSVTGCGRIAHQPAGRGLGQGLGRGLGLGRLCESQASLVSKSRDPLLAMSPSLSRSREKLYGLRSLSRSQEVLAMCRALSQLQLHQEDEPPSPSSPEPIPVTSPEATPVVTSPTTALPAASVVLADESSVMLPVTSYEASTATSTVTPVTSNVTSNVTSAVTSLDTSSVTSPVKTDVTSIGTSSMTSQDTSTITSPVTTTVSSVVTSSVTSSVTSMTTPLLSTSVSPSVTSPISDGTSSGLAVTSLATSPSVRDVTSVRVMPMCTTGFIDGRSASASSRRQSSPLPWELSENEVTPSGTENSSAPDSRTSGRVSPTHEDILPAAGTAFKDASVPVLKQASEMTPSASDTKTATSDRAAPRSNGVVVLLPLEAKQLDAEAERSQQEEAEAIISALRNGLLAAGALTGGLRAREPDLLAPVMVAAATTTANGCQYDGVNGKIPAGEPPLAALQREQSTLSSNSESSESTLEGDEEAQGDDEYADDLIQCEENEEEDESEDEPRFTVAQLITAYNLHDEVVTKSSLDFTMAATDREAKLMPPVLNTKSKFPTGPNALRLFIPDIDITSAKPRKSKSGRRAAGLGLHSLHEEGEAEDERELADSASDARTASFLRSESLSSSASTMTMSWEELSQHPAAETTTPPPPTPPPLPPPHSVQPPEPKRISPKSSQAAGVQRHRRSASTPMSSEVGKSSSLSRNVSVERSASGSSRAGTCARASKKTGNFTPAAEKHRRKSTPIFK